MSTSGLDTTKALRIAKLLDLLNKKSPYGGVSCKEMAEAMRSQHQEHSPLPGPYRK